MRMTKKVLTRKNKRADMRFSLENSRGQIIVEREDVLVMCERCLRRLKNVCGYSNWDETKENRCKEVMTQKLGKTTSD